MRTATFILSAFLFLLSATALHAQNYTGKWRWQIQASPQDIQSDYLLELDLKQVGNKVVGTRTLYLKKYENMVVWVEGEVNEAGELNILSKRLLNFKLPDSILVATSFGYSFKRDRFNNDMMVGVFRPQEDTSKRRFRRLDPTFYDAIYQRPVQSIFKKLADTIPTALETLIAKQLPPAKPTIIQAPKVVVAPSITKPAITTEIEHELTIPVADVSIDLYDNGTIDGDIVTVLVNDKIVSEHQKLGLTAINITIKKEELKDTTTIIMIAENLGDIPPNSALMLITVAGKRYDLNINTNLQKRAAIILYKKK